MKLDPMQDRGQKGEKKNMDKEDCRLSCRQKERVKGGEKGRRERQKKKSFVLSFAIETSIRGINYKNITYLMTMIRGYPIDLVKHCSNLLALCLLEESTIAFEALSSLCLQLFVVVAIIIQC